MSFPSTTFTPLSFGTPPRHPPSHHARSNLPSIRGRLSSSLRPSRLSTLLDDLPPDSSSPHGSESEAPAAAHDNLHYDSRRRVKRPRSRIARPKDAMPGFKRRKHYKTGGSSRFSGRGGMASSNVGARHLDRRMGPGSYYGGDNPEADRPDVKETEEPLAPVCYEHAMPCMRLVCKKAGRNKGRAFYKCSKKARYQQCDYFKWADQVTHDSASDDAATDDDRSATPRCVEAPALVEGADAHGLMDAAMRDVFGLPDFRPGQREALARLLRRESTLALLPTGAGKSLIYQAFAAVRPGMVLVVSPLVSLMHDQVHALPERIPGAFLRAGQTLDAVRDVEHRVRKGEVKVLFVSPERLFSARFRRLLSEVAQAVSLVAVDEAHCLSQWSHNFRTAYLRLPSALFAPGAARRRGGADVLLFPEAPLVLALTATAAEATVADVCASLHIDVHEGVVRSSVKRDNLLLTLSHVPGRVDTKASELVRLFKQEPFGRILDLIEPDNAKPRISPSATQEDALDEAETKQRARKSDKKARQGGDEIMIGWGSNLNLSKRVGLPKRRRSKESGSIIVYVGKQRDCETVVNYLKSSGMNLRGKVAMYHAGLAAAVRNKTQAQFETGSIAILVATVAFGMGLNYSNIRGVVHFDMPSSLERYSQEVGRAGRDGRDGFCHVFYNEHDARKLLSRSHSDGVDASVVRRFLRGLVESSFRRRNMKDLSASESDSDVDRCEDDGLDLRNSPAQTADVVMSMSEIDIGKTLDLKLETAETICAILEREIEGFRLLKSFHLKMRVKFFSQTPDNLLKGSAGSLCPADKALIRLLLKEAKYSSGHYDLSLRQARFLEDDIGGCLRRLQRRRHISFESLEPGMVVQCSPEGSEALQNGVDKWAGLAHSHLQRIEDICEMKARAVADTFGKADTMMSDMAQSGFLHEALANYFSAKVPKDGNGTVATPVPATLDTESEERIRQACRALFRETSYGASVVQTGRQVARILHGLDSPGFRAKDWWKCGYWGKFINEDFRAVTDAARGVIRQNHTIRHETLGSSLA